MTQLLILMMIIFQSFGPLAFSQVGSISLLNGILDKMEARRQPWTALKAEIALDFITEATKQASCKGNLTYRRLDEKLILTCFNASNRLMFAFKTNDEEFELYIPGQNTKITGSIFDLEDSPDIDAYLKPLDLYRALKPMAILQEQSLIEQWTHDAITIRVHGQKHLTPYLARKVDVSHEGDILREIYYSFSEEPYLTISRHNFHQFKLKDSASSLKISYPQKITIHYPRDKAVALSFTQIKFYSYLDEQDWIINTPSNTHLLNLDDFSAAES